MREFVNQIEDVLMTRSQLWAPAERKTAARIMELAAERLKSRRVSRKFFEQVVLELKQLPINPAFNN